MSKEFSKHQYGFERLSTGFLNQFESLVGAGDELTVSSTSRCYSELGFPSATLKQIQKFSILAYLAPYFPQYENTGRSASFRANNTMINMEISKCFVRSPIYPEHANFYDFYSLNYLSFITWVVAFTRAKILQSFWRKRVYRFI